MYTKHIQNAPRKMQEVAKHFNPIAASATIALNEVPKHNKTRGVKIWNSYGLIMGRLAGNTYVRALHGAIGSEAEKAKKNSQESE